MQYLVVDTHQRFLGSYTSSKALVVGDTFQAQNTKTYAVIGLTWAGHRDPGKRAVTVIPVLKSDAQN